MAKLNKIWLVVIAVILFLFIIFLSIKLFNNPKSNPKSVTQKETEQTQAWTWSSIEKAEAEIMAMVDNRRHTEAKRAINQLISDFSKDDQLPKSLYWIAERYRWSDESEEATNLYNKIIKDYPNSPYARKAEINIAREEIISLIKKNDYTGAQKAVNSMLFKFSGDPDLAESLYWIAGKYYWSEKYDEAKKLYQEIVWNYPKSSYIDQARLGFAKIDLEILFETGDYAEVQRAVDKMIRNFPSVPGLPEVLCRIADKYHWGEYYEEAKNIFKFLVENYHNSSSLEMAKFGLAREEISLLIDSHNYDASKKAIDNMIIDFDQDPKLPETLYWIAEKYTWMVETSKWSGRYDAAKKLYEKIIRDYPDSSYASKAKLGLALENAMYLVISHDYNDAQKAVDKMVIEFAEDSKLPTALYLIAGRYEWVYAHSEAKKLYQRIATDYPDNPYANEAKIRFLKEEVVALIAEGKDVDAQKAFDRLIADVDKDSELIQAPILVGVYYTSEVYRNADLNDTHLIQTLWRKAAEIWERVIQKYHNSEAKEIPGIYYRLGIIYGQELGEYQKGIDYLQKVLDNWPNEPKWNVNYAEINYYLGEYLARSGIIPLSEAIPKMKRHYKTVIDEYPDYKFAGHAIFRLGCVLFQEGNFLEALEYFKMAKEKDIQFASISQINYFIGECYRNLIDSEALQGSLAISEMEKSYKAVIEDSSNSKLSLLALLRLGQVSFEQSKFSEAAKYFEILLEKEPQQICAVGDNLIKSYEVLGDTGMIPRIQNEIEKNCPN